LDEKHERQKPVMADIVYMSVGIVMVVLYVTLGTTIIFKAAQIPNVPPAYAQIFGFMLIFYGIFRGYKVYRKHVSKTEP
jgi:hypothetical protein